MRWINEGFTWVVVFCALFVTFCLQANAENSQISEQNKYKEVVAYAELYYHFDNAEKVIEILQNELLSCEDSIVRSYLNFKLGIAYLNAGRPNAALPYLQQYRNYKEYKGDSIGIIEADIALSEYYRRSNDISNATTLLLHTLNVMPHSSENELKARAFVVLSEVSLQTNNFSEARTYAQKAMSISSSIDAPGLKLSCFNLFSELYEKMGDFQSALYYKNKRIQLQDSILKSRKVFFVNEGGAKMGLNEDSEEEKQYASNSDVIDIEDKNKSLFYLVSITLLFVFALIFFVLFRSKVVLSRKLKQKNKELENLNATKDKFFSIIAHDLKSPFNSLMGFSEVLSLQVENKSPKEIMEYSRSIHNSTRKLYSLVETLLQWSRTQLGTTEYKPERMDVRIVTSNIISILKINAEEKDIVISLNIDGELIAWADKDLFSAVLRNLVSNAIKFSRVGSVITVTGKNKANFIEIAVSDSGVGISKDNLQKIFKVDSNLSTIGTFNEKGTGLGLVLCKEFVEINKGVISAESKLEKGSTFKFTVPLSTNYSLN